MSLILCRQEPVKHPFYFEGLGVHLYSSQELCYVIYQNPLLVLDHFVDEHLIEFIRDELEMGFMAAKLEKWQQSGEDADELLFLILTECDYYNAAEIKHFRQKIETYRKMSPHEFAKAKADYLFTRRQYGKAVAEYEGILEMPKESSADDVFYAKIYNNLGAAYARLFSMEKAYQAYQKSFDLAKSGDVLKRIYYLSKWNPNLVLKDRFRTLITEDIKTGWDEEMKNAEEAAEKAESLEKLEELFLKDPIKRMKGAADMVKSWKGEYRNMI